MRRFASWSSASIVAFVVAINFLYFCHDQTESMEESSVFEAGRVEISNAAASAEKSLKSAFLTQKEKALLLFGLTINEWLEGRRIEQNVAPNTRLLEYVQQTRLNYPFDQSLLVQNAEKGYKTSLIDVNNDGNDELAIVSNCSADICQLWIFKQAGKDFNVILSSYQDINEFKLRSEKTNGYLNIETIMPYAKSTTFLAMRIWKYNGREYIVADCFDYEFRYVDKEGNLHNLDRPKLYPLHCC